MNWEDLKYLLAFRRAGSLAGAAGLLAVDATTVSRRLSALQNSIGAGLLEKAGDGRLVLTAAGVKAADCAEQMDSSLLGLQADLSDAGREMAGEVRISSVAVVINRILIPGLGKFTETFPGINLHLAAEARNISLTRREADMAIRLGRPREGGHDVIARRIASLDHAIYAARRDATPDVAPDAAPGATPDGPWILYHETMGFLPQARWLADNLPDRASIAAIRPNDLEGVIEAIAAGLGRSILPVAAAQHDSRLVRLPGPPPDLQREVWLLQHKDQAGLARMKAVGAWLEAAFAESAGF